MKGLGNIRDVFKTVKHKKPTAIFCPRCGSPEIKLSSSLDYWLTPRKYVCPKCGYTGIIVMELEPDQTANEESLTEDLNEAVSDEARKESSEGNVENQSKPDAEN